MGEVIENIGYAVKEDGTIIRNRECPECGQKIPSHSEFCLFCGAKINGTQHKNSALITWLSILTAIAIAALTLSIIAISI